MRASILICSIVGIAIGAMAQTPLQRTAQLSENERIEDALKEVRSILAKEPANGEAWFLLGEIQMENDQLDSAAAAYQRGSAAEPSFLLNMIGKAKVDQANGNSDAARAGMEAVIQKIAKMPKEMQARIYRNAAKGLILGTTPDHALALRYIDKAIELLPNEPDSYIVKGDIELDANPADASKPLMNYRKAMDLAPNTARPIAKRAYVYHRGANPTAAIAEYDKAITLDPTFAPAFRGRAESHFMARDYEKAVADYQKYLELNQGSQSARSRYAQFLFLSNKYAESLELINALEQEGVKNNTLARLKGYNLVELGDTANALNALETYFEQQPPDRVLSTDVQYYGKAIAMLGNDSLAGEKLLAAASMNRADPNLYAEAGSYFLKAKMYDKAVEAYQKKVASPKVAVNDWYYLGGAANRAQQFNVADSAWANYVVHQPNIYQGYLGRARAQVGLDPEKTTWQAKPFYEDVIRRMTPEDISRSPIDAEEAYFYLAFYNFTVTEDLPVAKCWFEKVKALNAGTGNTKIANDMLLTKELKDVNPAQCEIL